LVGFDNLLATWFYDVQQIHSMARLWLFTNYATRDQTVHLRKKIQDVRLALFYTLHPRRIWLYLRLMRLIVDHPPSLLTDPTGELMIQLVSDENSGPEDIVVDCKPAGLSHKLNQTF
jgi:hypothetical protein